MYTAESIIQRNILVLEFMYPLSFKEKVYNYIASYTSLSVNSIIDTMNALSQILIDKGLSMSSVTVDALIKQNNTDDINLVAQVNALATLVALKSVPFEKPLSWWKNVSCQLIDVNIPSSDTLH